MVEIENRDKISELENEETAYEFRPYKYKLVDDRGVMHELHLIALTQNGHCIQMTDYHRYVGDITRNKHLYAQNRDAVRRVCNFLNYVLFNNYWLYKVTKISDIPFEAAVDYLLDYATTETRFGDYPSEQSVTRERNAVCLFMSNLSKWRKDRDEHYYARQWHCKPQKNADASTKNKKIYWEYEIHVRYLGEYSYALVRDIPRKAILSILRWVKLKAPDLYFAVLLQICAGLREGEVVNVRRASSCYYGGIAYSKVNGDMQSFKIDLNHEYQLRSDSKTVGRIKKHRDQFVYPIFLRSIQRAYEDHLKLVPDSETETYGPMFVTRYYSSATGKRMALTRQAYCKRIIGIVEDYVMPELLASDDVDLRAFALSVNSASWGLHAFRHFFTAQLALNESNMYEIASARGDICLESAFTYLNNNGEINKKYANAATKVTDDIMQIVHDLEGISGV